MADLSDVENAVVTVVINALYPNGLSQVSAVGAICRVYRGWPSPAALNADLSAGIINVTVFPAAAVGEVPDAYFDHTYSNAPSASLVVTTFGQTVIFSGLPIAGQTVGILVDGRPFVCAVTAGDTTENVAANLTASICQKRLALLTGPTLTIPGAKSLIARVVANASVSRALRRQRREIQIDCWCPSAALRDSVSSSVDLSLATSSFVDLADGTKAHVRYVSTQVYDQSQNALLYRRSLCFNFEYTIIESMIAPVMLFGDLVRNGNSSFP
jgi:hypothetical protein